MARIAILIGNTDYKNLSTLSCCKDDVLAMDQLLLATERFDHVHKIENKSSDELKILLRNYLFNFKFEEIFLYFSGHGVQIMEEFFYCPTDFSDLRPNETGLSNTELHTFLRASDPDLVVKVIDACNSGTVLIKGETALTSADKGSFKSIVQIASCLETQSALTGDPLSLFTESFCKAAIKKTDGIVYYSDIINIIRDDYLSNNQQIPFFVSQGTAREIFVEDASKVNSFRAIFESSIISISKNRAVSVENNLTGTLAELLTQYEKDIATPEKVDEYIETLFRTIVNAFEEKEISKFFESETVEFPDYLELVAKPIMARILANEKRPDRFVTAINVKARSRNSWGRAFFDLSAAMEGDKDEDWEIKLNCTIKRAQLKITLIPKFKSLRKMTLTISCAPSLNKCYLFELVTEHMLVDWNSYQIIGKKVVDRWYKLDWQKPQSSIVNNIVETLMSTVQKQLASVEESLKS